MYFKNKDFKEAVIQHSNKAEFVPLLYQMLAVN